MPPSDGSEETGTPTGASPPAPSPALAARPAGSSWELRIAAARFDRQAVGTLHVLDPTTGLDRVLFEGPAYLSATWQGGLSRDGRRVAAMRLRRHERTGDTSLVVIDLDGSVDELEPSFLSPGASSGDGARLQPWMEGWIGPREMVFAMRSAVEIRRLEIIDVETGQETRIPLFAGEDR